MSNVSTKFKILIFLICIIALISTVNSTYSRYVSASEGVVTTNFARWQIFINNQNVTENYGSSITFTPVIEANEHVAANKIAPSSKGYFDIAIDPTNVDVSFTYDINFNIPEDSLITDIKVTDYAFFEGTEITDDTVLTKSKLDSNSLSDTMLYNNKPFSPFIIRVYFAWLDDTNGTMNDESDSSIGDMIANDEDINFELGVNINFKQYTGEESTDEDEIIPDDNVTPDNEGSQENTDLENTSPDNSGDAEPEDPSNSDPESNP